MAKVSSIKLDPQEMEKKAQDFEERREDFETVVEKMKTMVTSLCEEWSGQSSDAFAEEFTSLEPSFQATSELITDIAQQLRDVSKAMQSMDQEIANKISGN